MQHFNTSLKSVRQDRRHWRSEVIKKGKVGWHKTHQVLKKSRTFKNMHEILAKKVKNYDICQRQKPLNSEGDKGWEEAKAAERRRGIKDIRGSTRGWEGDGLLVWSSCGLRQSPTARPLFGMEVRPGRGGMSASKGEFRRPRWTWSSNLCKNGLQWRRRSR